MSYVTTVYGILPVKTWNVYRAMGLLDEAQELHRYVRLTERAETFASDAEHFLAYDQHVQTTSGLRDWFAYQPVTMVDAAVTD